MGTAPAVQPRCSCQWVGATPVHWMLTSRGAARLKCQIASVQPVGVSRDPQAVPTSALVSKFVVLAVAALAIIGLAFVLRSDWAGQKVCAEVRLRAPDAVGMPVRIERCVIDPLTASVEIHGVSVGPEARPVVKAELASVSLAGLFPSGVSL